MKLFYGKRKKGQEGNLMALKALFVTHLFSYVKLKKLILTSSRNGQWDKIIECLVLLLTRVILKIKK